MSLTIRKLDDLYKFELSKFMFDCINGLLPTPILEYFFFFVFFVIRHSFTIEDLVSAPPDELYNFELLEKCYNIESEM